MINSNEKFNSIWLYIILAELVFGGLGHLFGLPIRNSIFAFTFFYAIYLVIKRGATIKKRTLLYIFVIIGYGVYGSIIGLINGNAIRDIISNANVFAAILYSVIYLVLIDNNKNVLKKLVDLFVIYADILAIIVYGIFQWSNYAVMNGINPVELLVDFQKVTQYGLITQLLYGNTYAKVYASGGIFFQVAFAICLLRLAYMDKIKLASFEAISIIILIMGIVSTGTRGYWLGAFLVIGFTAFVIKGAKKIPLILNFLLITIIAATLVVAPGMTMMKIYSDPTSESNHKGGLVGDIFKRANSATDFSEEEISNNLRGVQFRHLMNKVKEHPVFGSGFGSRIEAYAEETERGSLDFELYYFELWFKTGTVGMLILFVGVAHLFYYCYKVALRCSRDESTLIKGWTIGFISVGGSSATNPYLAGMFGFFILVFLIVIIDLLDRDSKEIYLGF